MFSCIGKVSWMVNYGKKEIPPGRYDWHPTPLMEQVVLVTSADSEEEPHVATKSRISVVSYGPPTLIVFACRAEYKTAANIKQTKQFVVNIPGDNLVATSWVLGSDPGFQGKALLEEHGLTSIPGLKVDVPRIAECRAHLECEVEDMNQFGPDLAVFGKVVSSSVNEKVLHDDEAIAYRRLAPFFFLDSHRTASLGTARLVDEPVPGPRHDLTILPVARLKQSFEFYGTAFDWPVKVNRPGYVEFELPGGKGLALCTADVLAGYLGGTREEEMRDRFGGSVLHFTSENLARTIARLVSVGAKEIGELRERDRGEESACFSDLDGNVLVVSRVTPSK